MDWEDNSPPVQAMLLAYNQVKTHDDLEALRYSGVGLLATK